MVDFSDDPLAQLVHGTLYRFADWPNDEVPDSGAGVYTVWDEAGSLVYAGMAGRELRTDSHPLASEDRKRRRGVSGRLHAHASGRRSGDQFCAYVFDRLVLPGLTPEEISAAAAGSLSLDALVRDYVRDHLSYRFVLSGDGTTALAIERAMRRGGLWGSKPLLNPL